MVKQKGKFKFIGLYLIVAILLIASVFSATFAWFTASSNKSGELTFANISLELGQNGTKLSNSTFKTSYLNTITPGDSIDFNNISVKNTGNSAIYSLLQLNVGITAPGFEKLNFVTWYNLLGNKVNTVNLPNNTVGASLVNPNETSNVDFSYTFNGDEFDNNFKNASVEISLSACGMQSYLPESDVYAEDSLYAVELLINEYNAVQSSYTRAQYLESTGTQYIVLNYYPNQDTSVEVEYLTTYNSKQWIYGARTQYLKNAFGILTENTARIMYAYANINSYHDIEDVSNIKQHDYFISNTAYHNNALIHAFDNSTFTSNSKMAVFGLMSNNVLDNRLFRGKIYSFTISEKGVVLFNLIPVLDIDGVACMYDTINHQFYYNQGSENFNYTI